MYFFDTSHVSVFFLFLFLAILITALVHNLITWWRMLGIKGDETEIDVSSLTDANRLLYLPHLLEN